VGANGGGRSAKNAGKTLFPTFEMRYEDPALTAELRRQVFASLRVRSILLSHPTAMYTRYICGSGRPVDAGRPRTRNPTFKGLLPCPILILHPLHPPASQTSPVPSIPYSLTPLGDGRRRSGELHYFGVWSDPDAALKKYDQEKEGLHAGRKARPDNEAVMVWDAVNAFLNAKKALLVPGSSGGEANLSESIVPCCR